MKVYLKENPKVLEEIEKKTLKTGEISFDFGPYFVDSLNSPTISDLTDKLQVLEDFKDEDSIFIDSIEEITKSKMDSYFPKKEKQEVVATSQKVELGDFQALLKIEGATKLEITQEGKTLFIIN